jgi:hypothetical protein
MNDRKSLPQQLVELMVANLNLRQFPDPAQDGRTAPDRTVCTAPRGRSARKAAR